MAQKIREAGAQSNVTRETFLEHFETCSASAQVIADASSAHRLNLKAARAAGLNSKMLMQSIRIQRMDADKRRSEFRSLDLYLRWLDTPTGTQFGFLAEMGINSPERATA